MTEDNRLTAFLKENGVPFQTQHHAQAFTAQEIAASEHVPGKMLAKVVMLTDGDELTMAVLPAPDHVDLKKAQAAVGGKPLRLAQESEFAQRFPDCEIGAMPPFGNLYDVPVYVDDALTEDETIVFTAGSHTDTMSLAYDDFERLAQPNVADLVVRS
jgi:Ala-tRNA(Pro) deacylase